MWEGGTVVNFDRFGNLGIFTTFLDGTAFGFKYLVVTERIDYLQL